MLRQHNLDDMKFAQIVEAARLKAPEYYPVWNNLNTADPGVTIIELFAWLTELQRYHLNSIEAAEPFFPLLGIAPLEVSAASVEITIAGGFAARRIPAGTPLYAEDVRFEMIDDIDYTGDALTLRIIQRETVETPFSLGTADGRPGIYLTVDTRRWTILDFALTVDGKEWMLTDNFRASKPDDKHYMLNPETGDVTFGDGYRGLLPYGEVVVTKMSLTRAADGNIASNRITELDGLPVIQPEAAVGGAVRENAKEALKRSYSVHRQAATAVDIEQIVFETPGLDIDHVHAFTDNVSPEAGEARVISIAVKLKGQTLTEDDKVKIIEYLEPYRLVCREFRVLVPDLVHVRLTLELRARTRGTGFREELEQSLRSFFAEQYGGFGVKIRVAEIRAFAGKDPEILEVTRCTLNSYGGAKINSAGDITLAPGATAILSELNIRLTDAIY